MAGYPAITSLMENQMDVLVTGIAAIFGLVIGSFLNVVVYRVPNHLSVVRPASACPRCNATIRNRHNVPVLGWIMLRGRCYDCGLPISARYPLVEAGTSALFGMMAWLIGPVAVLPAYLWFAALTLSLALVDLDTKKIPNRMLFPGGVAGLVLLAIGAGVAQTWGQLGQGLLGGGAYFAVFLVVALIVPGGFGMGDVKLAGLLGLFAGYQSWGAVGLSAFLAVAIGGAVSIALLASRRVDRKTTIPFGPSMVLGSWVAIGWSAPILEWYLAI